MLPNGGGIDYPLDNQVTNCLQVSLGGNWSWLKSLHKHSRLRPNNDSFGQLNHQVAKTP